MKIDRAMMQRNSEISFIYQSMPFCKLDTPPFNPNKIKKYKKIHFSSWFTYRNEQKTKQRSSTNTNYRISKSKATKRNL